MPDIEQVRQKLHNANALHGMGNIAAAMPLYREVLRDWPGQPDALHMLGVIAMQMGNASLALQFYDETLKAAPQFAIGWVNRAIALRFLECHGEARQSVEKALAADPGLASAWNMSGILLRDERRYDEALEQHARAAALAPGDASIQMNYAAILLSCSRIPEAWQAARLAEKLNPHRADTLTTLGNILAAAGYPERALPYYQKAQAADPRYIDAFVFEGTTRLYIGDLARGWELMEKRRLYLHDERCRTLPRWDGAHVQHLLLCAEQGAGDTIQAARYIAMLKPRADRVTLQVPAPLQKLMRYNFPGMDAVTPDDPLPEADMFEPLMSLCYHCAPPSQEIPSPPSYLRAGPDWRAPWRERLQHISRPRIGFTWAGNPRQVNDYNRSIPFDRMARLLNLAGKHAVAAQKSFPAADLSGLACFDAAPWLEDYAATAGLFEELDLLITADTSTAHLMGALGRPVWVLLPFDPGWRYMLGREDSPWYPSMRLFRQREPRDWNSVVAAVTRELEAYLAGNDSVLLPQRRAGPPARQNPEALVLPD